MWLVLTEKKQKEAGLLKSKNVYHDSQSFSIGKNFKFVVFEKCVMFASVDKASSEEAHLQCDQILRNFAT